MGKIKVTGTVVELDGDEMTRVISSPSSSTTVPVTLILPTSRALLSTHTCVPSCLANVVQRARLLPAADRGPAAGVRAGACPATASADARRGHCGPAALPGAAGPRRADRRPGSDQQGAATGVLARANVVNGVTPLLTTHDLPDVERLCRREYLACLTRSLGPGSVI